jgi:hypothetical protein
MEKINAFESFSISENNEALKETQEPTSKDTNLEEKVQESNFKNEENNIKDKKIIQSKEKKKTSTSTTSSMVVKMAELSVEEMLQTYLDVMRPNRPITMQEAAEQTQSLYRVIESIFKNNKTQEAFNAAWSKFLGIVKQYRNEHFHESRVYRGVPQWSLGNIAYVKFTRLIQLALETCEEGANSKFLKTINLDRFFTEGFSEEDKQKIMNFYHLT